MRFFVRSFGGVITIGVVNYLVSRAGFSLSVGINPITFLTSGTLGIPGVLLLYGVVAL